MNFFLTFLMTLLALGLAAVFLAFARKNISSRCGSPESCDTCKKTCKRKMDV